MPRTRISEEHEDMLMGLYGRTIKTLDDLPYTAEFEKLYVTFVARSGLTMTRHDIWRVMTNLRKARKLKRKKK